MLRAYCLQNRYDWSSNLDSYRPGDIITGLEVDLLCLGEGGGGGGGGIWYTHETLTKSRLPIEHGSEAAVLYANYIHWESFVAIICAWVYRFCVSINNWTGL